MNEIHYIVEKMDSCDSRVIFYLFDEFNFYFDFIGYTNVQIRNVKNHISS